MGLYLAEFNQRSKRGIGVLSALTFVLSPRRGYKPITLPAFSTICPANPVASFAKTRRTFLLLLGEKAGMREDVCQICVGI
jgi:hypothetical protein